MSAPTVPLNKRGFTLIEVMVAILIMTVGLLGLMATADLAVNMNTRDYMRNQATQVGERSMSGSKNLPYANISSYTPPGHVVTDMIRGVSKNYTVNRTVEQWTNSKHITIVVNWTYKGQNYYHGVSSVVAP